MLLLLDWRFLGDFPKLKKVTFSVCREKWSKSQAQPLRATSNLCDYVISPEKETVRILPESRHA
jgi:hypothetical protein